LNWLKKRIGWQSQLDLKADKSDFKEEKISTLYFCISQVVCKLKEKEKIDVKFGKICRQPVLINWTGIGKQGKRKYFNFL